MAATPLDDKVQSLIAKSYPQATGADSDPAKLTTAIFTTIEYSPAEKTEVEQWTTTAAHMASSSEDAAKTAERLAHLNTHLATRTTVLGSKPSVADVALYNKLASVVKGWSAEQRTGEQGYHHITRFIDFVQNAELFSLKLDGGEKVEIDPRNVVSPIKPIDAKAEKERKKKEKAAAAAAGADTAAAAGGTVTSAASEGAKQPENQKPKKEKSVGDKVADAVGAATPGEKKEKPKKEKQPKQPKNAPAPDKPFGPALIDLRVGHILKAIQHPDAEKLFVSTIACGDAPGTDNTSEYEGKVVRTVCSGLNGLIPLEEMQGRKIVAVCNLKPVTMRGIKSSAMVLAASPRVAPGDDDHGGPVELVSVPADAEAGERVYFEGFEGEPDAVLNPKKKVWEDNQVGFTTTADKVVAYEPTKVEKLKDSGKTEVAQLRTKQGVCTVQTLTNATVR
ncbi:putative tRNA-binding domain, nucleic acid-binding, glutathione S-transferase domain superfamily [Septoria linicola]|nr:putative tRNA-binding domain, nucleic acid-binding, glutathione S-transferase domain superfamily [Septoria linicola]